MATTAASPALLLLPYIFVVVVLLQPPVGVAARPPLHAPAVCARTGGVQPVALSKTLDFCGGRIGDLTCCDERKDSALRLAFVNAFSSSSSSSSSSNKQQQQQQQQTPDAACAALIKDWLCAVCFPVPDDTPLPASCAALAPALLSSSAEHLARISAPALPATNSMCLEKVSAVSYSGLTVAPDGSGRVLLWNHQGEVWLASMPPASEMQTALASPFIDLSGLVRYDEARGLRGLVSVVAHPSMDGRLVVSYTTTKSDDDCGGMLVVEELSPRKLGFEHTTVFSMEFPAAQAGLSLLDLGGQIFFRPNDPSSLYLVTGHGVSADFVSPNKNSSFVGKVLRLHVDQDMPGTDPEVFFSDLNIPRGCVLDYSGSLYCAKIDETQRELVYLIFGNDNPSSSATSVVVLDLGSPTAGMASASIVWGLPYEGSADASLRGRYIYAYNSAFWSAAELPPSSSQYAPSRMLVDCSRSTPIPCQDGPIVLSFAEDQNKEGVILATDGVYRIVSSGLCTGGPLAPAPASRGSSGNTVWGWVGGAMGIAFLLAIGICFKVLQEEGKLECFRNCFQGCTCGGNGTCICCSFWSCW